MPHNVTKFDLKDLKHMHDQNSSVKKNQFKPNLQIDQNMTAFTNYIDTTKATMEGVNGGNIYNEEINNAKGKGKQNIKIDLDTMPYKNFNHQHTHNQN